MMEDLKFTIEERELMKDFYSSVKNAKLEQEESAGKNGWNLSKWTFEIMEYFLLGEEEYRKTPIPDYLKVENPRYRNDKWKLWYGRRKLIMIEELKKLKDYYDYVLICEVGFGIDILLCMMIKEWKEIQCYDSNPFLKEFIENFFIKKHKINVIFEKYSSYYYPFDLIRNKTILIANHTHLDPSVCGKKIIENKNLLLLRNGVITTNPPITSEECYKINPEINMNRGVI